MLKKTLLLGLPLVALSASEASASYTEMMQTLVRWNLTSEKEVIESTLAYEKDLDEVSAIIHGEKWHINKVNRSLAKLNQIKKNITQDLDVLSSLKTGDFLFPTFAPELHSTFAQVQSALLKTNYSAADSLLVRAKLELRQVRQDMKKQLKSGVK